MEVIPSEPIIIPDRKRGKCRGKKRNKAQKGNKFSKVQKRQVTMKQAYQTMHNLKWQINNSGNQNNHSWPAAPSQKNENDIDRRKRVRRTTESDYSNLLREYENVQAEIEKKKDDAFSVEPNLIRFDSCYIAKFFMRLLEYWTPMSLMRTTTWH